MSTLEDLLPGLLNAAVTGNGSTDVSSIVFNSRDVTAGALFVALRGDYTDGHRYLADARDNGAIAALVDQSIDPAIEKRFDAVVRVANSRAALAVLASNFYGHPSRRLRLVGITGTDGKTSTSHFVQRVLEQTGIVSGMIGTIAIDIPGEPALPSNRQTTPESLDVQRYLAMMLEHDTEVAILEATSHGLETHRVDGCQFDVGVITNVTHEHLDFHGSIESYRAAKAGLLKRVNAARESGAMGIVVLNADDLGAREISGAAGGCRRIWYSATDAAGASVRAMGTVHSPRGSAFTLEIGDDSAQVALKVPGRWSVSNALAAAGVGQALDLPITTIAEGLSRLTAIPGRMERIDCGQPFTVVVDYAHTPESLRATLTEMRSLARGRVLVMFGSAGERDIEKRAIQGRLAAELADFAVFTSEDPRFEDPDVIIATIAGGATRAGWRRHVDFECVTDRRTATTEILRNARPGDVVLLAGKGHERSIIYEDKHLPWNESEVARQALDELGYAVEA